ncbi:MAG: DeoR/GlpR family DNA-binding transcription regulator [Burkholderiaceae bacterium]
MLADRRKQLILERLRTDGQVSASALSADLGVSEDTIRRDLRDLAREGLLQRVHGGALPASPALGTVSQRERVSPGEKAILGRAGARLIDNGQVVFLDGGTTTRELVRALPNGLRATFVTHSPEIALELARHPMLDIILIGGQLFRHSMVTFGASTVESIKHVRADLFFLGVTGIHPKEGLSTGDFQEAGVKRAFHACAAETIVMASSEKLGAASTYLVVPSSEIAQLIVVHGVQSAVPEQFASLGIDVTYAS